MRGGDAQHTFSHFIPRAKPKIYLQWPKQTTAQAIPSVCSPACPQLCLEHSTNHHSTSATEFMSNINPGPDQTEHFPQEPSSMYQTHPRKRMGRTRLGRSGAHSWGCQSAPCHGKATPLEHHYKALFLPIPGCSDTRASRGFWLNPVQQGFVTKRTSGEQMDQQKAQDGDGSSSSSARTRPASTG